MPILAKEPDLYPEDLLAWDHLGETSTEQWWAVYTRSRREKELMRKLRGLEVPFFGPLVRQKRRSPAGRVRTSFVPLFANYVFIYGDQASRYQVLTTNCVSRTIAVPDGLQLTHDLQQIHHLLECDVPVLPEARVQPGARVRVRSGMLAGQEGTVLMRRGERRLVVAVNFMQQGASVLLDDFDIEQID